MFLSVWLNGWVFVYELSGCGFESSCSHYFNKVWNPYFLTYCQNSTETSKLKRNQTFWQDIIKSDIIFFDQKILKYFNDFQNRNFSDLWLKWIQTMEMKQNQSFFHGAYSNLTSYHFLSKNIKVFQWFLKSKYLSYMTKVNPNNGNETKSDIFKWDILKLDIIFHWSVKY